MCSYCASGTVLSTEATSINKIPTTFVLVEFISTCVCVCVGETWNMVTTF